jgi:hypothetical protein
MNNGCSLNIRVTTFFFYSIIVGTLRVRLTSEENLNQDNWTIRGYTG